MAEQMYRYTVTETKILERVLEDNPVHLAHMVLPEGEGFPAHEANATVYMTVIRGQVSVALNGQPAQAYQRGDVIKISKGTRMQGDNEHGETAELIVLKHFAP